MQFAFFPEDRYGVMRIGGEEWSRSELESVPGFLMLRTQEQRLDCQATRSHGNDRWRECKRERETEVQNDMGKKKLWEMLQENSARLRIV